MAYKESGGKHGKSFFGQNKLFNSSCRSYQYKYFSLFNMDNFNYTNHVTVLINIHVA